MSKPTNAAIVDLNGRKWQPFESLTPSGHVRYTESEGDIHIPYGTDPVSLTIQAHELSHVRYSAKVWTDVEGMLVRLTSLAGTTAQVVGYAEDMRITALAGRLGIKTLPQFGNPDDKPIIKGWIDSFVAAGIPKPRVLKAARFILTQHTAVLKGLGLDLSTLQVPANAERYIVAVAQHIHKLLSRDEDASPKGGESTKDESKKAGSKSESKSSNKSKSEKSESSEDKGDKSDSEADSKDDDSPEGDIDEGTDSGESSESGSGDGADSDKSDATDESSSFKGDPSASGGAVTIDLFDVVLPDIRQAMLNSVPPPVDTAKLIQSFQHTLDTAKWVPVKKIDRMPLVRRAAQSRNRGRKLSEVGVALGSAYDAVSPNERRPFVAKRRGGVGGLTVLIDCSGSMHIAEKQLEALLLKHPQGVVVTYASNIGVHSYGTSDSAVVRVIASHGRLAANSDFRDRNAGGNGCDGPVLEWLAKQSGERVWVCDGVITEQHDQIVPHDTDAREAWLKAHRITQFVSLNAYLKSLT